MSHAVEIYDCNTVGQYRKRRQLHLVDVEKKRFCGQETEAWHGVSYGCYRALPRHGVCPKCRAVFDAQTPDPDPEIYAQPEDLIPHLDALPILPELKSEIQTWTTSQWIFKEGRGRGLHHWSYFQNAKGHVCQCVACDVFEDDAPKHRNIENGHCEQCHCSSCVCPLRKAQGLYARLYPDDYPEDAPENDEDLTVDVIDEPNSACFCRVCSQLGG